MKMANTTQPQLVQLFENLLWANSPNDWILKSTYFQETLFVSMLVPVINKEQHQKIRRSFALITINQIEDIWGMAADCVDEMRSSIGK